MLFNFRGCVLKSTANDATPLGGLCRTSSECTSAGGTSDGSCAAGYTHFNNLPLHIFHGSPKKWHVMKGLKNLSTFSKNTFACFFVFRCAKVKEKFQKKLKQFLCILTSQLVLQTRFANQSCLFQGFIIFSITNRKKKRHKN